MVSAAKQWIDSVPQSSSDDLCLLFCINPSSMAATFLLVVYLSALKNNIELALKSLWNVVADCSNWQWQAVLAAELAD